MLDVSWMREWKIVVASNAIPSEQYAAEEFQALWARAFGYRLPIQTQPTRPIHNIFIGQGQYLGSSREWVPVQDLGEEGLRIRITETNIVIAGGKPRGALYGVYEFMERYLGIRFLTFDHTHIPTKRVWRIPCETWSYVPPFTFRWSYYKENQDHPAFAARLRVNTVTPDEKLGGITPQRLINHTLHDLLPVKKYGRDHPEYFALVDGERKLRMEGGGPQVCASNPEVIETIAQNVIRELDKNPGLNNYSVSQNDNDAYCRCEKCEAINRREGTPMGSLLAMVNAVAERVEARHPAVKIGTLAYWYSRKPPKTLKPRRNVQILLCSIECSTLYPLDDPKSARNRAFHADLEAWSRICDDLWIWNYNTNFRYYDLPFPNLRVIGPNLRFFLKIHARGVFMQANGNGNSGEMCDLRNYVMSRCLWNPKLDSWKLAREFCLLHYGGAGQTLFDYLDFLHDNAERGGFDPNCFPMPFEIGLNPTSADRIFQYFTKALAQSENAVIRNRVEKASISAYRAVLEVCGQLNLQNGLMRIVYPQKYGDVIGDYLDLTKKHGQTRAEELRPIEHYYQVLDKATREGYPARMLENSFWRMVVGGDAQGKMIELRHKPSDRDLLIPNGYRSLRYLLDFMVLCEIELQGGAESKDYALEKIPSGLRLVKALEGGSTIEREIGFDAIDPEMIRCRTTIRHQGQDSRIYQLRVHPEFHTRQVTTNHRVVSAYIRDVEWTVFNHGWSSNDGPGRSRLEAARGGGYAFYNHRDGYGMALTYPPTLVERPAFWWSDTYPQLHLDLITKPVRLEAGESHVLEYQFKYLRRAPRLRRSSLGSVLTSQRAATRH